MRRRTTAHKRRAMTVRLKQAGAATAAARAARAGEVGAGGADAGGSAQEPPPAEQRCRKHRRRPRAMLEAHDPHAVDDEPNGSGGSGGGSGTPRYIRWLETHIWHAKRCEMTDRWGWRLPLGVQRGPRAAVAAVTDHCTVRDVTFLRPLEVRGPRAALAAVLSTMMDPMSGHMDDLLVLAGYREAEVILHRPFSFPRGCLARVRLLWSPKGVESVGGRVAALPKGRASRSSATVESAGAVVAAAHAAAVEVGTAAAIHWNTETSGSFGGQVAHPSDGGGDGSEGGDALKDELQQLLWVWVHPAAFADVRAAFIEAAAPGASAAAGAPWRGSVGVGAVDGGVVRLEVRGCRAQSVLSRVLVPAASGSGNDSSSGRGRDSGCGSGSGDVTGAEAANARTWAALTAAAAATTAPGFGSISSLRNWPQHGAVLGLTVSDPGEVRFGQDFGIGSSGSRNRNLNSVLGGPASAAAAAAAGAATGEGAVPATLSALPLWPQPLVNRSNLWDRTVRRRCTENRYEVMPEHVRNAVRHSQRKAAQTTALKPSTGAAVFVGAPLAAATAAAAAAATGTSVAAAPVAGAAVEGAPVSVIPVVLVTRNAAEGGGIAAGPGAVAASGWDLVLPAGWAAPFWHALVFAGARAIGISDAEHLAAEAGCLRFPQDFPDTPAGRRHWQAAAAAARHTYEAQAPKHRGVKADVTAAAAVGAAPFGPDFDSLLGLTPLPSPPTDSAAASSDVGSHAAVGPDGSTEDENGGRMDDGEDGGSGEGKGGTAEADPPFVVVRSHHYAQAFVPPPPPSPSVSARSRRGGGRSGPAATVPPLGWEWTPRESAKAVVAPPSPPLLALPSLLTVELLFAKGIPTDGAAVLTASPQHYEAWAAGVASGRPWPGITLPTEPSATAAERRADAGYKCGSGGGDGGGSETALAMVLIGYITTGSYSQTRGCGWAVGLCEAGAVKAIMDAARWQPATPALVAAAKKKKTAGVSGAAVLVLVCDNGGPVCRPAIMVVRA
ncbi:unnamed protein product [Phaeothamnion confervicola]